MAEWLIKGSLRLRRSQRPDMSIKWVKHCGEIRISRVLTGSEEGNAEGSEATQRCRQAKVTP